MRKKLSITLATATAAALTGGLLVAAAGPAAAAPGLDGDFNGDGYRDVAVTAPLASVNGKSKAGAVTILYGSPAGAGAKRVQTLSQNSAGVPGTAEKGDQFGAHTAPGDYNGDGYADLAVGAPGEDAGSDTDGGTVVILWGGSGGLSGGTTVSDPSRSTHDWFGQVVAAGDYDGDGRDDLAIASDINKVDIYRGGFTKSGSTGGRYSVTAPILKVKGLDIFNLTPGDIDADGRTDLVVDGYEGDSDGEYSYNANYWLPGSSSGVTKSGARKLPAGVISDIGDVDGDGHGDIVIGNSWDAGSVSAGVAKGGAVEIVYGTAGGPEGAAETISQNTAGVPGSNEKGDGFGHEVSLGDINGDGHDDLVVGAPGEDLDGVKDSGMVSVLYGWSGGLRENGSQALEQNTPGVPGSGEEGDGFGGEVLLSDVTGDGKADLTVGIPWENAGNGYVVAFTSDGTKIDPAGRGIGLTPAGISSAGNPLFGFHING
ncbi:FG-GAP-like repeat-containing protein [Streptomyces sp. MAR25Y5]|uniref:FG-GAP-like repeat-containing protein n=1 Tax=Streptomyces sp. MAR25Y5 TaxID=2962028 RepID=UPI0020B69E19|nr:FG-GAP-like repeat-containing protein [Streptomyces sp. MAR25Y5]MCP3770898.1 FG-GAP-like repeat-containing protein [Streptomyces sp. MAR25Y5]